jgi:putative MFS transporter
LWQVTLLVLVLVLKMTPAYASYLTIWISLVAIFGRFFCAWLSDALGRRPAGILTCLAAALTMSVAGYLHHAYLGTVSLFYAFLLINSFFGPGTYAIIGPYMTEVWPASLRASGLGLAYGISNLGKFIGPAGLALIAGTSNYVSPQATLDAIIPGFNYFAVWYVLAAIAFWLIAIETRGRTIEELDAALTAQPTEPAAIKAPAV